jgi:hypothetical protein
MQVTLSAELQIQPTYPGSKAQTGRRLILLPMTLWKTHPLNTISGMRITSLLCAVTLLAFSASPAWSKNLSSVDGNVLLTKCQPALHMTDVSPKLSQDEWASTCSRGTSWLFP